MKILFAGLKYDYGLVTRGPSLESITFVPAIQTVADSAFIFWFEENGFPNNIDQLQDNLVKYAEKVNPDLIFFLLMDNEINVQTLKTLSQKYLTLNWFCDDTWRFENFSKNVSPYLSFVVTNDKFSLNKYKKIGCKPLLSQWGTIDYNEDIELDNVTYKYDISFVGSINPARKWVVEELKKNGLIVHCFGAGWDNGRVDVETMKNIFYTSKINLNLSNSVPNTLDFLKHIIYNLMLAPFNFFNVSFKQYLKNGNTYFQAFKFFFWGSKTSEQIKARNFEIPGYGGFQVTQYALELEDYYSIGDEIAIFTNPKDLVTICRFYLENEEIRKNICKKAHRRTKKYNYVSILRNLTNDIKEIISYESSKN